MQGESPIQSSGGAGTRCRQARACGFMICAYGPYTYTAAGEGEGDARTHGEYFIDARAHCIGA